MDKLGPVELDFLINNPEFKRSTDQARDNIKGITTTAQQEAAKMDALYKKLGTSLAAYFSFQAAAGIARDIAMVRGEFQQLEIGLTTILGSKEKADKLLGEVVELAAKTPFSLQELAQGSKNLLAYQFASEDVTGALSRLGNVASGLNIPFNELVQLYGKTRVEGRLFAEDLNQYTGRGIPIIGELAKIMGVAESEVRSLVTAGKVGFPEVEKVIQNLTNEGGQFFNLMENLSGSIPGKISNLGDAFDRMYNNFGKANEGVITDSIDGLIQLVDNYEEVIEILKAVAVTYGTYRAAVLLTSIAQKALTAANAGMTASQILLNKWTVIATRAQALLNATMLANPFVATATALAALITAVTLYNRRAGESVSISDDFKKSIKEETTASKDLFKALKDTAEGTKERSDAIAQVNKVYKDYLPQQLTEKSNLEEIETAQKAVNVAIAESIFLRSQESDLIELREKSQSYAEDFGRQVTDVIKDAGFSGSVAGALSAEFDKALGEMAKFSKVPVAQVQERLSKVLREFGIDLSVLGSGDNNISTYNYDYLIKDTQSYAAALYRERQATEGLSAAKKGYLQQLGLTAEAQEKESAETEKNIITLKQLKEQLQEYVDAREKIDVTDTAKLAENEKAQVKLQEQIAKLEIKSLKEREKEAKKTELELLKERLDKKRKAYEDYYLAIEALGKETAQIQFADLIKEGENYEAYLKREQTKITPNSKDAGRKNVLINQQLDIATGAISPQELLKTQLDDMKQLFADFETYKQQYGIAAAKEQYASQLAEYENYLEFVKAKTIENQAAFTGVLEGTATPAQREIAKILERETKDAERDQTKRQEEFLAVLQDYNTIRLRMISDYNAERAKLVADGDLQEAAELDRRHAESLKQLDDQNLEKLESYQELQKGLEQFSIAGAKRLAEIAQGILDDPSLNLTPEKIAELKKQIKGFLQEVNNASLDNVFKIGNAITSLGAALSSVDNSRLANLGSLIAGLGSNLNNILVSFDDQASKTDVIAAGINGIVNLVGMLAGAAKKRKEAEAEYYRSVIGFQNEYNLSLNEQIRLQSMIGESVFLKDFEGRIKDGLSALQNANEEYQTSLAALSDGRAKSGQRNAVDWGNVGEGAAAGAAAGAAIGTVIPVIGNAVGLVVGGIVGGLAGLFGGKKKKDTFVPLLEEYNELIQIGEDGVSRLNRELADTLIAQNLVDESTKQLIEDVIAWEDEIEKAREQVTGVVKDLVGQLGGDVRNALVQAFRDGEDAALAMGATVEKVLEDMVSQIIFNRIFADQFQKLQDEMIASYDPAGDREWIDDFERFFSASKGLGEDFNQALKDAQAAAAASGFDIFKPDGPSEKQGLQGGFERLTEQTGSELAGLARAEFDIVKRHFQLDEGRMVLEQQHYQATLEGLNYWAAIANNTGNTVDRLDLALVELKTIVRNTKKGQTAIDLGVGP